MCGDRRCPVRSDSALLNGETRSFPPACVLAFCSLLPRPLSLRAGGWLSPLAPPPRTGCLCGPSPPQCCCRGGGQGTQPLAQSGFPVRKILFLTKANIYMQSPPEGGGYGQHPLKGGSVLFFFLPRCCKDELGGRTAPSLSSPLQGKRLWPHKRGSKAPAGPKLGHI